MIFIVPIEPIDQRYTKQWYYNIPKDLEKRSLKYRIVGDDNSDSGTTTGAFLNFAFTNKYKAQQVQQIADLFSMGHIAPGDKFLVTDAWNFAITAIRYMSDEQKAKFYESLGKDFLQFKNESSRTVNYL